MYYIQVRKNFGVWKDFENENPFETLEGAAKGYWYWRSRQSVGTDMRVVLRDAIFASDHEIARHKLLGYR